MEPFAYILCLTRLAADRQKLAPTWNCMCLAYLNYAQEHPRPPVVSWSTIMRMLPAAAAAEMEWMVIILIYSRQGSKCFTTQEPGHLHGAFCSAQASKLQSPEYACSDVADMTKRAAGRILCTGRHFTPSDHVGSSLHARLH